MVGKLPRLDWDKLGPGPERWQKALNERFPPNARWIPDQPNPIKVRVRIEWERDGEEWVPGTAIRWDRRHVLVRIGGRRYATIGFWMPPEDVQRV
jgi:hypothetical protein